MISKFSVKKSYTVIVGIVLVLILGIVAYRKMTVDLLPSMELPYAIIMTTYPGASPEAVETGVTKPIEQQIATIDNVDTVQSMSADNYSMIIVAFTSDANMDAATIDMREKLDQITGYFDDSVGNPIIMKLNPNMMPVMVAAVDMAGSDRAKISHYVEDTLSQELEGVEGVASVTAMGTLEESVHVVIRQDKIDKVNKEIEKALDQKFQDAQAALDDAKSQISSGKSQLAAGETTANSEFAKAEVQIDNAKVDLLKSEEEAKKSLSELNTKETELKAQQKQVESGLKSLEDLYASYKDLIEKKTKLEAGIAAAPDQAAALTPQLEIVNAALAKMEAGLAQQKDDAGNPLTFESLPTYISSLKKAKKDIADGLKQIKEGKTKLSSAMDQISAGKTTIDNSYIELKTKESETQSQLTQSKIQLQQGEAELNTKISEFDAAKDAAYEGADMDTIIQASMIEGMLTAQNFDYPAGYVTEDDVDYLVRVGEKFENIDELSDFVLLDLGMDDVDPIKLSDVADVFQTDNSDEIYTSINGNPGIILSMAKQNEYSTKDVADRLNAKFKEISKSDKDISFTILMDQGMYIDLVSGSVLENLVVGALLAVLILLFFLKDIRPTGIIAVSIPVSVVFAIVLMYFSGVTLNIISLSGLALGVGMLVDNSIVVIENIYRLRSEGYSVREAAVKGADQMVGAITASTLTTVCVFLPIVFTSGITKELFSDMGLTIAFSLFASLIVAVTFVPMVASKTFNKVSEKENRIITRISAKYATFLPKVLKHKLIVYVVVLALFVGSGIVAISKGFSFFPEMDSPQMTMTLKMPEDTKTLKETEEMSEEIISRVLEIKDIKTVGGLVGGDSMSMIGLGSDSTVDTVSYYIECKDDKEMTNQEIADEILAKTKDLDCELNVSTSNMDMSALMTSGVSIQIKGKDTDKLQEIAKEVGKKLEKVKGLEEIDNGVKDATPEYKVIVDKNKAAKYGLTVAQVYQAIQGKLAEPKSTTTLNTSSKDYPIYVSDEEDESYTLKDIKKMTIEGTQNQEKVNVRVDKIADVENATSLSTIMRLNQVRYIAVSAQVKDGYTVTAVSNEVEDLVNDMDLPDGYSVEYNGENETVMEAVKQVMLMMILAVAFMYLIMVAQFQSLKSPFIIMFTLPLAFTGGFAALVLTGKDVSIIALVGMVMLAGIIVNNGIVFVDTVNQLRDEGMDMETAIVTTGKHRLRPIVMTALTTILGLLPMSMGIGTGADMAQPMALVVIGGLVYGTLLTLVVVPCIYQTFNRRDKRYVEDDFEREVQEIIEEDM